MKKYLKIGLFMLGLSLIIAITSNIYANFKLTKNDMSVIGISGEKKDSLDYLVLGDSETYTGIIPLEIWHEYGYTGYIIGTPAQRISQSKDVLLEALKNQKPKLVILEINTIFRQLRPVDTAKMFIKNSIPLFKYHDNWKFLIDKETIKRKISEKGYVYSEKVKASPNKDYKVKTDKKREVSKENIKYLEDIINICSKNNIKLLLVGIPSSKNWTYKKYNTSLDFAAKYNLEYEDFNLDDSLEIDWDTDTQDGGDHLNYVGAMKFTKVFSKYLNSLNILEDHRNDEYYKDWYTSYDYYIAKFSDKALRPIRTLR